MTAPDDDLPKGLKRRTVDATPNVADLFRGYARGGYSIPDAIAEYVDNSLEQIGDKTGGRVTVDFKAEGSGINTFIKDNGGGAKESDALRFIQPGNTGTSELSRGISRFGMGGKTAGLSVAKQVRVYSRFPGESGFLVILDNDELKTKKDWKFEVYDIPTSMKIEPGETIVVLRGMSTEAHARREKYRERFAWRYAALLRRPNSPTIVVDGTPVVPRDPEEQILKPPELPAVWVPITIPKDHYYAVGPASAGKRAKIDVKIVVGAGASGSTTANKGARIFCNGRAVGDVTKLGLTESEDDSIGADDIRNWLRATVYLDGPVELMPWTNRKDSLDRSPPSYRDLETDLHEAYKTFLDGPIAKVRKELKAQGHTVSRTTWISEWLEDYWRKQIANGTLNPKTVRPVLRDAPVFGRATRPKADGEAPGPPSARGRGIVRLIGAVDEGDVRRAKELMMAVQGLEELENSDLVRLLLKHFLECPSAAESAGEGSSSTPTEG